MIKKINKYFLIAWRFLLKYKTAAFFTVAILFFAFSFIGEPSGSTLVKDVNHLEKKIQHRQQILESYVKQVLDYPVDQWLDIEGFPDDMVLYRYNEDTLQSWINLFPISNDEVDIFTLWYRIKHLNSRNLYNTPLAYLGEQEQYVNLGSAWYVVKVFWKGRVKLFAGLLIKTEYLSNNSILTSRINPNLGVKRRMNITPLTFDEGYAVKGLGGSALFSVIDDVTQVNTSIANPLRWFGLLFILLGLYSFFYLRRTFKSYLIYFVGLTALRAISFSFGDALRYDSELFSPNLYADEGLFSSLGNFLLNNLYVFLIILGFYFLRRRLIIFVRHISKFKRRLLLFVGIIFQIALVFYIDYTFRSLINNSSITLEIYRIEELSIYSVLAYLSYGLLFIALLLLIQLLAPALKLFKKNSVLSFKYVLAYLLLISTYTLITVSYLGYRKECERAKVWVNKLSVERDIGLELQLRSMENKLASDPIIAAMLYLPQGRNNLIQNRMEELYLKGVSQKYEIKITLCRPNDMLLDSKWQQMVDCNGFYDGLLASAFPLADKSNFFYLNNYNGRVSYLGVFSYNSPISGPIKMYIELDSRYAKDISGYPALLFDYKPSNNVNMPQSYSYAKYIDNRLVIYRGSYNYPMTINPDGFKAGFSIIHRDGSVHFANKSENGNLIVISRAKLSVYPYLVSFSYLFLFYLGLVFVFMRIRGWGKRKMLENLPKNSFRRKITYLITMSLVISLICMGAGSIWFCINYYTKSNRLQMEEKLQTVQTTISDLCKYAESYNQINNSSLFQTMDRVAANTQADINLYDPHGRLIRSTQPEMFERYLLASRMNPKAYKELVKENKKQVINQEKLAELSYYSLYAPIFNVDGKLIAIANMPYFSKNSDLSGDISTILAAIINVYILLLLAAILGGTIVSNQLAKPLAEISRKMQYIDVSTKVEHINYKNKDELGVLVGAYNKMVDDLEESTQRLAQTEREHAWSEMARQIAHEIKNPLTPMRLSIQHLVRLKQRNVEGWEDKFEDVASSILEQIEILSDTASEFSSFAKFYYEENTVINLYQIINEQRILFDTRDNIRIAYDYCSEQCSVLARKGQIIRVIVNLLSNAIQAIENSGRGYIKISLKDSSSSYIVSFEDNGHGVKPEDIHKLFKPNFTTKSSGTGLGLAISRNIIEQSGGKIFYEQSEFGGANFSFSLPKYIDHSNI